MTSLYALAGVIACGFPDDLYLSRNYTVIHNYRTPSYQRHNLVNIRFISTKISTQEREIMLCEVLSEFLQCTAFTV